MATLSEQLQQAAEALSIAGVPATPQPGQTVTASLAPPLTAVQFTEAVPTDVGLDLIAKDVRFDLLTRPEAVSVRLALTPSDWSLLKGIQPYVALSPSTVRPISESGLGLAAPNRETADEPWKGLGMGAGIQWHLTDRLDFFGQYQFVTLPGASASTGSPIMRRDSDNPGVRAGFSLHF